MVKRALFAGKAIAILALLAAPIAIHAAVMTSHWTALILAVPLLQLAVMAIAAGARHPTRIKWLGAAGLLLLTALFWAANQGWSLTILPGLPHAVINGALCASF